jgi:hypothetical protein
VAPRYSVFGYLITSRIILSPSCVHVTSPADSARDAGSDRSQREPAAAQLCQWRAIGISRRCSKSLSPGKCIRFNVIVADHFPAFLRPLPELAIAIARELLPPLYTMDSSYHSSMPFSSPAPREQSAAPSRDVSELPQHQVDAIIRTKRKAREPKACYPCHARKVKCDRNLPCDGCVKRDHANLCSYERPLKKRIVPEHGPESFGENMFGGEAAERGEHVEPASHTEHPPVKHEPSFTRPSALGSAPGVSVARDEWDNVRDRLKDMESTIFNLRMRLDKVEDGQGSVLETGSAQTGDASSRSKGGSPEREGIHAANTLGEGTVHLGSRSVLAYILNNRSGSDQVQALLEGGILPKLGLDNESATYPFIDLWSTDMSSFDVSAVCSALPNDQQCRLLVAPHQGLCDSSY